MWKLTDNCQMPYGKHQGVPMSDVPADYLLWLNANNKCSERVSAYINENLHALERRREAENGVKHRRVAVTMPFGSYKGRSLTDVPAEYLMAMYENEKCPNNVLTYIKQNIATLESQAEQDRSNRILLQSIYK